jgi:hypothetical protein
MDDHKVLSCESIFKSVTYITASVAPSFANFMMM